MPRRPLSIANRYPSLRLRRAEVAAAVETLDAHANEFRGGCPAGELSIAFLTDANLARLHADFLNDPSMTDVITFEGPKNPNSDGEALAGEICVSVDAAIRQTRPPRRRRNPRSTPHFAEELMLYVVHGWLHLAGYDDLVPAEKRVMRRAEGRALQLLRGAKNFPGFSLASSRRRSTRVDGTR